MRPDALLLSLLLYTKFQLSKGTLKEQIRQVPSSMLAALGSLPPADRVRFIEECLTGKSVMTKCDEEGTVGANSRFSWDHSGLTHERLQAVKTRFWNIYSCIFEETLDSCPVDGAWSLWSDWAECSATCGEFGKQNRTRVCNNPLPQHGGFDCIGEDLGTRQCDGNCLSNNTQDSVERQWSRSMIQKLHHRYPKLYQACIIHHCSYEYVKSITNDKDLDSYWSVLHCVKHERACPVIGNWSAWGEWTACSAECGDGWQQRFRKCDNPPPSNNGYTCSGASHEDRICAGQNCEDGVSGFTDWFASACSVPCGSYGTINMTRMCYGKTQCDDGTGEKVTEIAYEKPCFLGECPVEGGWSAWSDWGPCAAKCGDGRTVRLRLCSQPFPHGGADCVGDEVQTAVCSAKEDGDDCQATPPITAKEERRRREINVDKPARGHIWDTPFDPNKENDYEAWSQWTPCSATCNVGTRSRTRTCKTGDQNTCMGETHQMEYCNTEPCPVNGQWGDWLPWSPCSVTCGSGQQKRYRRCDLPYPEHGGACEGPADEEKDCTMKTCLESASKWREWSEWTPCEKSCGGGTQQRTRECVSGGAQSACIGPQRQTKQCGVDPCPVHGKWSDWGRWTPCSRTCGAGVKLRDRTCTDPAPSSNGKICPGTGTDVIHCFHEPCVDIHDTCAQFRGDSYLHYKLKGIPAHSLTAFVKFKTDKDTGVLMHRFHYCKGDKCTGNVILRLADGHPELTINIDDTDVALKSNQKIQLGIWQNLLVFILHHEAFLILNDEHKTHEKLTHALKEQNLDQSMYIGHMHELHHKAYDETPLGFYGDIAQFSVNFKSVSMKEDSSWRRHGKPDEVIHMEYVQKDLSALFPTFHGDDYLTIPLTSYVSGLEMRLVIKPEALTGLIAFVIGEISGTFAALILHQDKLRLCVNKKTDDACAQVEMNKKDEWYYIHGNIQNHRIELRVNENHGNEVTLSGVPFQATKHMFVGGGPSTEWVLITMATDMTSGFHGLMHSININGNGLPMSDVLLFRKTGSLTSVGSSVAGHYRDLYENEKSVLTLRCDYSTVADAGSDVSVGWFKNNHVIAMDKGMKVIYQQPGGVNISTLVVTPDPEAHHEGFYVCLVTSGVQHFIRSAFGITFHQKEIDITLWQTVASSGGSAVVWIVIIAILLFIGLAIFVSQNYLVNILKDQRTKQLTDLWKPKFDEQYSDTELAKSEMQNAINTQLKKEQGPFKLIIALFSPMKEPPEVTEPLLINTDEETTIFEKTPSKQLAVNLASNLKTGSKASLTGKTDHREARNVHYSDKRSRRGSQASVSRDSGVSPTEMQHGNTTPTKIHSRPQSPSKISHSANRLNRNISMVSQQRDYFEGGTASGNPRDSSSIHRPIPQKYVADTSPIMSESDSSLIDDEELMAKINEFENAARRMSILPNANPDVINALIKRRRVMKTPSDRMDQNEDEQWY